MARPFVSTVFLALALSQVSTIKIKVGHIGAINAMPKAEVILEMCRRELWKEGVLSDKFDVE